MFGLGIDIRQSDIDNANDVGGNNRW